MKLIADDNSDTNARWAVELQISFWRASATDLLFNIFCTKDNIYSILTSLNLSFSLKQHSFALCFSFGSIKLSSFEDKLELLTNKALFSLSSLHTNSRTVESAVGWRGVKGWGERASEEEMEERRGERGREVKADGVRTGVRASNKNIWCWQRHQGVSQRAPFNSLRVCVCVCLYISSNWCLMRFWLLFGELMPLDYMFCCGVSEICLLGPIKKPINRPANKHTERVETRIFIRWPFFRFPCGTTCLCVSKLGPSLLFGSHA